MTPHMHDDTGLSIKETIKSQLLQPVLIFHGFVHSDPAILQFCIKVTCWNSLQHLSKHGPQKSVFYQLLKTNFNLIPVHLQPDGLRKGQREPTDRRLHCTLSGPRWHGRQDVRHLQWTLLQGIKANLLNPARDDFFIHSGAINVSQGSHNI